jgi:outer membrane protein TolC
MSKHKSEDGPETQAEALLAAGAEAELRLLEQERRAEVRLAQAEATLEKDQARLDKAQERIERSRSAVKAAEEALRAAQEERAVGPDRGTQVKSTPRGRPDDHSPPKSGP